VSNLVWLYVALAITFGAIGGYVALLISRQKHLEERLAELQRRMH
jgi:CcmD family protein